MLSNKLNYTSTLLTTDLLCKHSSHSQQQTHKLLTSNSRQWQLGGGGGYKLAIRNYSITLAHHICTHSHTHTLELYSHTYTHSHTLELYSHTYTHTLTYTWAAGYLTCDLCLACSHWVLDPEYFQNIQEGFPAGCTWYGAQSRRTPARSFIPCFSVVAKYLLQC